MNEIKHVTGRGHGGRRMLKLGVKTSWLPRLEKDSGRSDSDKRMTGSLPNRAREGNQICYKLPDTGFLSKVMTKTQSSADLGDNQPHTLQMGRMRPSSIK